MVKRLNLALDDDLFERLKSRKGDRTWKEFLSDVAEAEEDG